MIFFLGCKVICQTPASAYLRDIRRGEGNPSRAINTSCESLLFKKRKEEKTHSSLAENVHLAEKRERNQNFALIVYFPCLTQCHAHSSPGITGHGQEQEKGDFVAFLARKLIACLQHQQSSGRISHRASWEEWLESWTGWERPGFKSPNLVIWPTLGHSHRLPV